jgi:hypothetical protein
VVIEYFNVIFKTAFSKTAFENEKRPFILEIYKTAFSKTAFENEKRPCILERKLLLIWEKRFSLENTTVE